MQAEEGPEQLNIYKLSRLIKRKQNDLYNSLRSIYADSLFVSEIRRIYPSLPLLANLRCGIWYSPHFDGSCYFKSTDGHTGKWSFSCTRLNIHVAELAARHGGCMIVDATRRGKRYPDSLSKTVPIWCCVLNRALEEIRREEGRESEYKAGPKGEAERGSIGESKGLRKEVADWRGVSKENEGGVRGEDDENGGQSEAGESAADDSSIRSGGPASTIAEGGPCLCQQNQKDSSMGSERKNDMHQDEVSNDVTLGTLSGTGVDASQMESGSEGGRICEAEEGEDWVSLHLPLWLSPTEKAAIGSRVEGWVEMLKTSGADLRPLAGALLKPLRPLWVSQRTVIWLNEVADVSTLPFTPVICLSASDPVAVPGHVAGGGSGWSYVPGAGDDEESWARGLSPAAFWRNVHQILDAGPAGCKGAVARLVEEERVRVALRSTGFGPGAETKLNGTEAEGTERERNGTGFRPGAERKLGGTERKGIGTGVGLGLERKLDGTERKGSETGSEPRAEANGLSHRTERNLDRADAAPDALDGGSDRGTGGRHRGKKVGDGTGEVPDRTNGLSRTESSLNGSNGLSDGARGPSKEVSRDQRDAQSVRREVTSARNDVSAETCPSHIAEGTERDAAAESVVGSLDDVPSEPAGSVEQSPCHQSQRPSKDGLPSTQNDGGRGGAAECHPYDDRGMRQSDGFRRGELGAGFNEGSGRLSFIGRTGLAIGGASCCEDPEVWRSVDAILDCSLASHCGCAERKGQYAHLPIQGSKFDRRSLERHLPDAVRFCRAHLDVRKRMLIVCKDGYDVSVCVCLAILLSCFDTRGNYVRDRVSAQVTKNMVRQGLAFLSSYHSDARPSRGNLKQVFHFVNESRDQCAG